jgi:hypothetical protein
MGGPVKTLAEVVNKIYTKWGRYARWYQVSPIPTPYRGPSQAARSTVLRLVWVSVV